MKIQQIQGQMAISKNACELVDLTPEAYKILPPPNLSTFHCGTLRGTALYMSYTQVIHELYMSYLLSAAASMLQYLIIPYNTSNDTSYDTSLYICRA